MANILLKINKLNYDVIVLIKKHKTLKEIKKELYLTSQYLNYIITNLVECGCLIKWLNGKYNTQPYKTTSFGDYLLKHLKIRRNKK